jgi:hypothetical protein
MTPSALSIRTYCSLLQKNKPVTPSRGRCNAICCKKQALGEAPKTAIFHPFRYDTLQYVAKKEALGEHLWALDDDRKPLCPRTIDGYIAEAKPLMKAISLQRNEIPSKMAVLFSPRCLAISCKNGGRKHVPLAHASET